MQNNIDITIVLRLAILWAVGFLAVFSAGTSTVVLALFDWAGGRGWGRKVARAQSLWLAVDICLAVTALATVAIRVAVTAGEPTLAAGILGVWLVIVTSAPLRPVEKSPGSVPGCPPLNTK